MSYFLKPICTGILCIFCSCLAIGQFAFSYDGPDTLFVDNTCTAILDWGHPETPDVFPTMPGQVIISWMIFSISGGYAIGDPVPAGETVTIFYQARDNMGHISLFGFSIAFVDNTPPVFDPETLPDDVTVNCAGDVPIPDITFSDNCDSDSTMTVLSFDESGGTDVCSGGTIMRIWTITDAFGNTASFVQDIFVEADTAHPVITGIPVDGSAVCGNAMDAYTTWLAAQRATFMADDIGCGIASLTDNAPPSSVLLGFCGELEVAFFATDSCDNTSSVIASFLVTNDVAPTITVQATDVNVSCDSGDPQDALQDWLNSNGGAQAVDDCSLVEWSTDPVDPSVDDVCNGSITVTFIADDGCGNTSTTTAEFFIQDNTPPSIVTPAQNLVINCSTSDFEVELAEWLTTNGNSVAADICTDEDSLDVHFVLEGVTLDSLGVINAFQDSIENGTCVDGVIIDGFIFNNVLALITLDFVYTDNCGNAGTTSGIFAIRDALGPAWTVPSQDSILTCVGGDVEGLFTAWYNSGGFAEATDDCGSIFYNGTPSFEEALQILNEGLDTACAAGAMVEVSFQLNDFCGNTNATIESAVFGVVDSTGPVIVDEPVDFMFECSGTSGDALRAWLDTLGGADLQDACGNVSWVFSWTDNGELLTGQPGIGPYPDAELVTCNSSLDVTFSATDACDNTVSADAEFSFIDMIAPVIVVDSAVTIPCDSIAFIDISVSDNCTMNPVLTFIDVNMGGDTSSCLSGTLIRTWQATDECGNTSNAIQTIHTLDNEPPQFVAPLDTVIFCSDSIDAGMPTLVQDHCDPAPVITFEDSLSGTACNLSILRRWIVADACGNVQTSIQEIQLLDTLPPVFVNAPEDLVLECGDVNDLETSFNTWLTSAGGAALVDNCSDASFFLAQPGSYDLDDTLTWPGTAPVFPILSCGNDTVGFIQADLVYSDACGNPAIESLNFLVIDSRAPVIEGCLEDTLIVLVTGDCDTDVTVKPPRAFDLCLANSDSLHLSAEQPVVSEAPGDTSIVVDTIAFALSIPAPPAFAFSPATVRVTLSGADIDSIPEFFFVFGENGLLLGETNTTVLECDTSVTTFSIPASTINTWAEDGQLSFSLVPNTTPGGSLAVNDICPGATARIDIEVVQGTQDSLSYAYGIDTSARVPLDSLEEISLDLYAGPHTLTWYVTDCAGNESQCITHISVQDVDLPEISCPDDREFVLGADTGCDVPVALYAPQASDSCGIDPASAQFQVTGDTLIAETFFDGADSVVVALGSGTCTIVYTISDISGNAVSCSYDVIIRDTISPIAICQDAIGYVHPSGEIPLEIDPALIDGGSTDNCRIDTMIVVPGIFSCDSAGTDQLVELIIIDASGNSDTCIAQLTIEVDSLIPTYAIGICAIDTLHLFANVPPATGNPYTFDWSGPNGFSSSLENPEIPDVNASHSGTYTLIVTGTGGCTSTGMVTVVVDETNAPELTVEASTICEGDAVVLLASTYNQPVTYRWFRGISPGGLLLGTSADPSFSDVPPLPGQYSYYVIAETASCASHPSEGVTVAVVETPIATVQVPFIEVCEGGMFSLGTDIQGGGVAYQWTGPNGFSSNEQFPPVFVDVQSIHAGTYSLMISLGSCTSTPATTDVVVSPRPETPVISGDSIFCEGGTLILTINNVPGADQYIWTNPQLNSISTPGNSLVLNNIDESMEGTWTVIAMLGDCPSESSLPFTAIVEDMLPITASNDGPVCDGSGDSVTLIVTIIPGVTYVWQGPNGFSSTLPNPTVLGIEGTYSVTATSSSGCTSISGTTITTEDPPAITALSNTAGTCVDSTQSLAFAITLFPPDNGAYDYQWTGPNGFTSNLMNPVIPGLTSELNGTYTLVVSLGSCMSVPVTTEVNVHDAPQTPEINGIVSYCSGEDVFLAAFPIAGDSVLYIWNTPSGVVQFWNINTLQIDNATVTNSGAYSVVVQIDGCDSPTSNVLQVVVAQIVNEPVVQAPATVCNGDTIHLSTQVVDGGVYHWTGPNGFTSNQREPYIFPATSDASGVYRVVVQLGDCISDSSAIVQVNVLPLPQVPQVESYEGSVCLGDASPITLCVNESSFTTGAAYTWTYQGTVINSLTGQRCITITDFDIFSMGTATIIVSAELDGCPSVATGQVAIDMFEIPEEMANAGPDATYCADDEIQLNANAPSVGTGTWSSSNGAIVFDNVNDPFTNVINLSEGVNTLVWTLDYEACLDYSSDVVRIDVESTPQATIDNVLVPFGETVDINVINNDLITGAYTFILLPGGPLKGNALITGQGIITYDPNLGYVGPDQITYEICSVLCPEQCTTADVIIQVGDETDCFIPTLFTPNEDGTNDRLIIPCLETERFPQNRVAIFNEWGDAVFEAQPYLNDWNGTRDGKDLPVATYFYIVDFGDGRPVQNGFLILER